MITVDNTGCPTVVLMAPYNHSYLVFDTLVNYLILLVRRYDEAMHMDLTSWTTMADLYRLGLCEEFVEIILEEGWDQKRY